MATQVPPDPVPEILNPDRLVEFPAGERLLLYKDYMAEENARLQKVHDEGGGGCEVAALRSAVVDGLLRSLFQTAILRPPVPGHVT
ncbi:MAG: hypothetical protein QGG01_00040, partial [Roseibacillus sp.]|nr:hypothetical protein [Roseibacillus sp.]